MQSQNIIEVYIVSDTKKGRSTITVVNFRHGTSASLCYNNAKKCNVLVFSASATPGDSVDLKPVYRKIFVKNSD